MQTKFKRGQMVKLLIEPDEEFVEYNEAEDISSFSIKKGMSGKVNILLPNGRYHVAILDKNGNIMAYAPFDEESLEAV